MAASGFACCPLFYRRIRLFYTLFTFTPIAVLAMFFSKYYLKMPLKQKLPSVGVLTLFFAAYNVRGRANI
ncbi:hypothetical protein [Domibacillus sp.]|uniref:hypothetical protein n=1 Tax=Domibacillus sp. TaxID=1969783 RepID=UPI00281164B8|nr:hypothetical protein [Domibacillus sp.]